MAQIEKQLDRSLQRLGLDCIDLCQCRRDDKEIPVEETLAALDRAVGVKLSPQPLQRIDLALNGVVVRQ